jgi:RNA exonuclease 4
MSSNWEKLLKRQKNQVSKSVVNSKNLKYFNKKNPKSIIRTPLTKIAERQKEKEQEIINLKTEKLNNNNKITTNKINNKINNLSIRQQEIGKYIAMDCEFVGVGPEGIQSELARVSIVNFHGHTIYDKFVKPREKVTDWRTFVSGIRPSDMQLAISFKQAQSEVSEILKDRVLIGHAIHHDLEALYLTHPKRAIRDTSKHTPFKQKYSKGKTPSLKKLASEILGFCIQSGEHSSVEDAKATMLIYKSDKRNFEDKIRSGHIS